uniref:Uncharacterized protein n=1 Tax=Oryza meridionalis TaxID=40149 RepID=A0A0E0DZB5_9ORYZ
MKGQSRINYEMSEYIKKLRACFRMTLEVQDGRKESPGGALHFVALLPLFDPPSHERYKP